MKILLSLFILICFVSLGFVSAQSTTTTTELPPSPTTTTTESPATTTTTASPPSAPTYVETEPSICAMGYLKQIIFVNNTTPYQFVLSIDPCATTTIYPTFGDDGKPIPTAHSCGTGFAGWTDAGQYRKNYCLETYRERVNSTNAYQTIYTNGTKTLTVNWDCTGLQDDNPADAPVTLTAVSDDEENRVVTVSTKRCIRKASNELKAGVIVAIVVVVVFAVAVIGSVVKAKCFGAGSSTSGGGNNNHFAATRNNMTNNNNGGNNNRHFHAQQSGVTDANYQAM